MRFTYALLFFVFSLMTLLLYWPALHGEFIMDDWGYITENPWVIQADTPWRFWSTLKQTDYWPLTYTVYWLLWKLFGADSLGYHLVNVALHALNGVLIFALARDFKLRWPIFAALLFLVHPLHVQSVAWMIQSKTLLATSLALATVLCFRKAHFMSAGGFFAAALLSKTSVVGLPVVLWGAGPSRNWRLAPYFALALIGGSVTLYVNEINFLERSADVFHMDLAERSLLVIQNLIFYPKQFFWPAHLAYMYPLRVPETYGQGLWLVPAGLLALGLLVAVALYKPWREYRFWLLSYLALLAPCLGLVAIPNMKLSLVADHWAYLPDVFLACFVAAAVKIPDQRMWRSVAGLVLLLLSILTFRHAGTFATELAFWEQARQMNPRHAAPEYNLGVAHGKRGETDASIENYKRAIQRDLLHDRAWFNLGRAYFLKSEYEKSEECFLKAIQLRPTLTDGYAALATVYQKVGSLERAKNILEQGLKANPGDPGLAWRLNLLKN